MKRIVIIGNSGSGKTVLARAWSATSGIPVVHLDEIFWLPGGFNRKRPADEVDAMIRMEATKEEWISEGVFGDLAEKLLPRATHLVWLDLPWEECRNGLLQRGSESSNQLDPVDAEENFRKLLQWAEGYQERTGSCSHAGHRLLYEGFSGAKTRITGRKDFNEVGTFEPA